MKRAARVIANNDIVYLWWTYDAKIKDCLGFSVRRLIGQKPARALPAFVGFEPPEGEEVDHTLRHDTDEWPIQAFEWRDLAAPKDVDLRYEIVPMTGTPGESLSERSDLKIVTDVVRATDTYGPVRVVFNRGILSTQSLAARLPKGPSGSPSPVALTKQIQDPDSWIRHSLAGEAVNALPSLLERARKERGKCFLALYELTDPFLIQEIERSKGRVELILSNADGSTSSGGKVKKAYDKTNAKTRKRLHRSLGKAIHNRLLPKGDYIGHNKFCVYVDAKGAPRTVLTGSTNWTPTGLCAQTNNAILIDDPRVAKRYLDYWNLLLADKAKQAAPLRESNAVAQPAIPLADNAGSIRIWFSPNTKTKQKPKAAVAPPDMKEVFAQIRAAKDGVLFLVFDPGLPSILSEIQSVAAERKQAHKDFFVRGAISDTPMAKKFATSVWSHSALHEPNELITGVGGIPDHFAFWEKEIARLGNAVIHDKIVVIDPFRDDCCVITGSHNEGFKASYSNDENLLILRGNRRVAEAYATHVLDVVHHYNWRYKLVQDAKSGKKESSFTDLEQSDAWQERFFEGSLLTSRDRFLFPA